MSKKLEVQNKQTSIYDFSTAELDLRYEEKPIHIARMVLKKKVKVTQQEFKF